MFHSVAGDRAPGSERDVSAPDAIPDLLARGANTSKISHTYPIGGRGDDPRAVAVDYVAGMTDRFALRAFEELVGTPAMPPGF